MARKLSTTKGAAKAKRAKQVVNPVFLKFIPFTLDPFWQETFSNYAYGKLPKTIVYRDSALTYRKKSVTSRCEVDESDIEGSYLRLKDFMKSIGIFSPLDLQIESERFDRDREEKNQLAKRKWSEIKQVRAKDTIINDFLTRLRDEYKLSPGAYKDLTGLINLGRLFKVINAKTVDFRNGKLMGIKGLEYNPDTKKFEMDLGNLSKFTVIKKTKAKKKTVTAWEVFSKNIKKQAEVGRRLSR